MWSVENRAHQEQAEPAYAHSDREEETPQTIKAALSSGKIPSVLSDELRMVPLESQAGQLFQDEMEVIAQRLHEHWDVSKNPIRFFLMDLPGVNACQVKGANPPLIGFTKGCFIPTESEGFKKEQFEPLTTIDEIALILGHEQVHLNIEKSLNPNRNSKLEEGLANYRPIEAAFKAGFNPSAGLSRARDEVSLRKGKIEWGEIVDVHPIPESSLSIVEAALTQLNRKYGDISRESTPLDEHHLLKVAAGKGAHRSTLQELLETYSYEEGTPTEKASVLERIIRQRTHLEGRRFHDFKRVVNTFRKSLRGDEFEKDDILTPLFNTTLECIEMRSSRSPNLETLLSYIAPKNLSTKPIGRLETIETACHDFIAARDYATARVSAQKLIQAIKDEPLCHETQEKNILKRISFSQFGFPNVDKIMLGKPQKLSWNRHVQFAEQERKEADSPILEALLRMGIHEPRIYSCMSHEVAVDFFTNQLPPVFKAPHTGSSDITHLSFSDDRAVRISLKHEETFNTSDGLKLFYLVQHTNNLFRSCAQQATRSPEELQALSKLSLQIDALKNSQHTLRPQELLIGLKHISEAPELFISTNSERLESTIAQKEIRDKLYGSKDTHPELVRRIGLALSSKEITLTQTRRDEVNLHSEIYETAGHRPISASPLLSALLSGQETLLSFEEKQVLVSKTVAWEGFLDAPLVSYDLPSLEKLPPQLEDEYKILLEELSLAFPKDEKRITQIESWTELDTSVRDLRLDVNPLGKNIVLIHSLLLCSKYGETSPPNPAALERILDIIVHRYSDSEMPDRDIVGLALKMIGKQTTNPPRWSSEYRQACKEWKTLYQAGVMPHEEQDQYLHNLLDHIETLAQADTRRELFELLLDSQGSGLKSYHRIKDPELRMRLADSWSQSLAEMYGQDNETEEYRNNIMKHVDVIEQVIARADQADLLNRLCKAVLAQEELSKELGARVHSLTENHLLHSHMLFTGIEGLARVIQKDVHTRSLLLDYLAQPISQKTLTPLTQELLEWEKRENDDPIALRKYLTSQLKDLHKNFWALPIEVRALIMKEILLPQDASQDEIEQAFKRTLSTVFPAKTNHSAAARNWAQSYIDATPEHARHILLSALLVAGQKSTDAQRNTGFTIASFLESMGPAETKVGQAAQGHPHTPADIREDLTRLKTHADEPSRWDLFSLLDKTLEPEARTRIQHVGEILGSASLFIAVEITTNEGESAVLSLLRPNGCERAQFGFSLLEDMVANFDPGSQSFQVMRDILSDSRELIAIETNTSYAEGQRDIARKGYNNTRVFIDNQAVSFRVPALLETGPQHLISEKAPGPHFIDLPPGPERTRFAKAILAVELNTILSGMPFDNDRHGGNCRIEGNTVYHFDFGGMMLESPSNSDLQELSEIVVSAGSGSSNIDTFIERYFSRLREKTLAGEEISPLLKRAQKALLSLAEYSHDLTPGDLKEIIYGAVQSAHPIVKKTAKRALLDLPLTGKLALLNPFKQRESSKIRIQRGT